MILSQLERAKRHLLRKTCHVVTRSALGKSLKRAVRIVKRSGRLKRRKPLTVRQPLKCQKWFRKMADGKKKAVWNATGKLKIAKPIKKISRARRKRLCEYYSLQREFLKRNPICGICLVRGVTPANRSTEVHHYAGRVGRLLTYAPY